MLGDYFANARLREDAPRWLSDVLWDISDPGDYREGESTDPPAMEDVLMLWLACMAVDFLGGDRWFLGLKPKQERKAQAAYRQIQAHLTPTGEG